MSIASIDKGGLLQVEPFQLAADRTVRVDPAEHEIGVGHGRAHVAECVQAAFERAYKDAFGRLLDTIPVRLMNYRVIVIGRRPAFDMRLFAPVDGKTRQQCERERRRIFADGRHRDAPVYDRLGLAVGEVIEGPALLEQPDTTIFIDPGLAGTVDAFGNLIIKADPSRS